MPYKMRLILLASVLVALFVAVTLSARRTGSRQSVNAYIDSQRNSEAPTENYLWCAMSDFSRDFLDGKVFDENREIACMNELSRPSDPEFRKRELIVKGKVLDRLRRFENIMSMKRV